MMVDVVRVQVDDGCNNNNNKSNLYSAIRH